MGAKTTEAIAEFVFNTTYDDLPRDVVEYAKTLALSHLGQNIAGSVLDFGRSVNEYVKRKTLHAEAGVFGAGFGTCTDYAAFANGNSAHATELEDNNPQSMYSVAYWPTVFAMGEKLQRSGRDVLEALVIGYEVSSKLGLAFQSAHARGKQNAACASFGTAAAAAKLLRLNAAQIASALSIAASQVAGIRRQAGTGGHVVEAGFAGRNGICAAELAACGYSGQADILEGKQGFGDIWAGAPEFDLPLGEHYSLMDIEIRQYSCCGPAKPYIDAVLRLIAEHKLAWNDIEGIEHTIPPTRLHSFKYHEPCSTEQAHFSLPHVTVACFFDGRVSLGSFTTEKVRHPAWQDARKKVKVLVSEHASDRAGPDTLVTVTTRNGESCSSAAPPAARRAQPRDAALSKYAECMSFAGLYSQSRIEQMAEMTFGLDAQPDISTLAKLATFPDVA